MESIEEIIKMINEGKNFVEISRALKTTPQNIQIRFRNYVERNKELVLPCESIFIKIKNEDNKNIKIRATLLKCPNLFSYQRKYLISRDFQPRQQAYLSEKLSEVLKENQMIPVELLLKHFGINKKDFQKVENAIAILYPRRVLFVKDHVIYARKIQFLKFIDLVSELYKSMQELYEDLKDKPTTKVFFEDEGIKNLEEFLQRVQHRPLDTSKFIRTCEAKWELKAKAKKIENKEEVLKKSIEIANKYFCGFHIELLYEEVTKEIDEDFSLIDFRVLLIDSGDFKHYKGKMIKQTKCEKILPNAAAVLSVLDKKEKRSLDDIIDLLKEKGRLLTKNSVTSAIAKLNKEGLIKTEKEHVEDKKFKEKTGFFRKKLHIFYLKK